jgi:hypothetical protein
LEKWARDGPEALNILQRYCAATNAQIHPTKAKGICLGSHVQVWGIDPGTQVNFGNPGEPPIPALGIPLTTDMHIASTMIHGKQTRA